MADLKYLDGEGVQYLWNQIRASFATMSDLPTKVSQLNNDLGFLNSNEVNYAINAAIQSLSIPSKVSDLTNDAGYQTAQDVASAIGSLNIPTKTSDLNNDSDFQTGTEVGSAISTAIGALNIPTDTGDLTNSVEFQTLSEVTALINQAISGITSLHFEVVQTLPASGDSMTIYLVPKGSALLTNVYDEYIWYNNSWEKIGDTAVDLTNYIQKGSTFNNSRATATDASGNLVTTDTTATELGYLHGVTGDIQTQINGKAASDSIPTATSQLTNDSNYVSDASYVHTDNNYDATSKGIVDGVTAALSGKQATVTGAATTITDSDLTTGRALISDSNGKVAVSDTTSTELSYVHGVTSNIQTQLDGKATVRGHAIQNASDTALTQRNTMKYTGEGVSVSDDITNAKTVVSIPGLGKKLTGTVSGTSLAFTDASITATAVIDGPYIADVLIGITAVATSGTTVTYTFADNTANGKAAYIWVR